MQNVLVRNLDERRQQALEARKAYSPMNIKDLRFMYRFVHSQWVNGRNEIYWDDANYQTVQKLFPVLERAVGYRGFTLKLIGTYRVLIGRTK